MPRTFPLLLGLALWSPLALAFPPCPGSGVVVLPVSEVRPSSAAPAWATFHYAFHGHAGVTGALDAGAHLIAGKCREDDVLPVPEQNASDGHVGIPGRFAPSAGFGVVYLPDAEALQAARGTVEHTLRFSLSAEAALPIGEWVDVAQLQFAPSGAAAGPVAAVYRLRHRRHALGGTLQVIEHHATPSQTRPPLVDRIVAEVSTLPGVRTQVALRWRQAFHAESADPCGPGVVPACETFPVEPPPTLLSVMRPGTAALAVPATTEAAVAASSVPVSLFVPRVTLDVLGPGDQRLYHAQLDGLRAELALMGLLDYSVSKAMPQVDRIGAMRLEARRLP